MAGIPGLRVGSIPIPGLPVPGLPEIRKNQNKSPVPINQSIQFRVKHLELVSGGACGGLKMNFVNSNL